MAGRAGDQGSREIERRARMQKQKEEADSLGMSESNVTRSKYNGWMILAATVVLGAAWFRYCFHS